MAFIEELGIKNEEDGRSVEEEEQSVEADVWVISDWVGWNSADGLLLLLISDALIYRALSVSAACH